MCTVKLRVAGTVLLAKQDLAGHSENMPVGLGIDFDTSLATGP